MNLPSIKPATHDAWFIAHHARCHEINAEHARGYLAKARKAETPKLKAEYREWARNWARKARENYARLKARCEGVDGPALVKAA